VQRLVPKLRRGDVNEASFSFKAEQQTWNANHTLRTIREVSIDRGDVSIVNYAANPNTSATLRRQKSTLEQRKAQARRIGTSCGPWVRPVSDRRNSGRDLLELVRAKARRAKASPKATADTRPTQPCPTCCGSGRLREDTCTTCAGSGKVPLRGGELGSGVSNVPGPGGAGAGASEGGGLSGAFN
jgi:hypothetical protein